MGTKGGFLELRGTAIAESRVTTLAIVRYLDELEQQLPGILRSLVLLETYQLTPQRACKTLDRYLYVIVTFTAYV